MHVYLADECFDLDDSWDRDAIQEAFYLRYARTSRQGLNKHCECSYENIK